MKNNMLSRIAVLAVCALIFQVAVSFFQLSNVHAADTTPPLQPNIIVILADDMGWGDLCKNSVEAGHPGPGCSASTSNTPNLDTLAGNGIRLTNFYTPAPICSPARASLLTGRYPINHGVANAGEKYKLPSREVTIAQALEKLNYSTGMVGKWHLGWDDTYYPNKRGFNYYYSLPVGVFSSMYGFQLHDSNPVDNIPVKSFCTHPEMKSGGCPSDYIDYWCAVDRCPSDYKSILYEDGRKKSLTEIITDKAIEFIKNTESKYRITNAPFFLYVALPSPHAPLDIHLPNNEGYVLKTKSFGCCTTNPRTCGDSEDDLTTCVFKNQFEENNRPANSSLNYYSLVIHEIDARVQEVIDAIDKMPDTNKDTIVIFTSDNGTDMGISGSSDLEGDATYVQNSTGGLRGSKRFVFEGGVRVPFIAYWKGPNSKWLPRPVSGQLADLTDLFPTLLHAAGLNDLSAYYKALNNPPLVNGEDLMEFFTSGAPTSNKVQYYSTIPNVNQEFFYKPSGYYAPYYAYREYSPDNADGLNNFKLLFDPINNDPYCGPLFIKNNPFKDIPVLCRGWELYDIADDPQEQNNLSMAYDPVIEEYAPNDLDGFDNSVQKYKRKFRYFFPSIKDDTTNGWENYFHVQAKNSVSMDVKIQVYNASGTLLGTYIYSDTDPAANSPAVPPRGRVAQRPSLIAGSPASPKPVVDGSIVIETSVPAIASINTIANNYKGFDIYESAKPRSFHTFGKNFDGNSNPPSSTGINPPYYKVNILIQNIYNSLRWVTIELLNKEGEIIGERSVYIAPHATYKVRPTEITGSTTFNGSVKVYSNLKAKGDGLGLPVPAMNRQEVGTEALTIYEASTPRKSEFLSLSHIEDGTFGGNGTIEYQNWVSVVNPGPVPATVTYRLYMPDGVKDPQTGERGPIAEFTETVAANGGKQNRRPCWFKRPAPYTGESIIDSQKGFVCRISETEKYDFKGSIVIEADRPIVAQTNVKYDAVNQYNTDAFNIYDAAVMSNTLFFQKAFDKVVSNAHWFDTYIFIQNPENDIKNVKIEQYDNAGVLDGTAANIEIKPFQTYVHRPSAIATKVSGAFQGSVIVSEINNKNITGVAKYEVHSSNSATSTISAITIYRAMGQ